MSNFEGERTIPLVDAAAPKNDESVSSNTEIIVPRALKVIDWDEGMVTAGDSIKFLKELFSDLLNEARTAEDEIGEAIKASNYTAITRAAHKLGGTCSYFCCEATVDLCNQLKDAGHDGMRGPEDPPALRARFDQLYEQLVECLNVLRVQVPTLDR